MQASTVLQKIAPCVVAIIIPCLLGSCTMPALEAARANAMNSLGQLSNGGQRQTKFQQDQEKTVNQGTLAGAGAGGIVALALGRRLGPLGAVAVIAGGALLGNLLGQHVARKKALAQTTEANLDAAIKESQVENNAVKNRIASLQKARAGYQKRIAAARAQNNTQELAKIKGELKALDNQVGNEVAKYDGGIKIQTQIAAKVPSSNSKYASVKSTLRTSTANRSALESERKQIASLMNTL